MGSNPISSAPNRLVRSGEVSSRPAGRAHIVRLELDPRSGEGDGGLIDWTPNPAEVNVSIGPRGRPNDRSNEPVYPAPPELRSELVPAARTWAISGATCSSR